jgi:hypothetical protein
MGEDEKKEKQPYSAFARAEQIKKNKKTRQQIMDELFEPETKRHSKRDET